MSWDPTLLDIIRRPRSGELVHGALRFRAGSNSAESGVSFRVKAGRAEVVTPSPYGTVEAAILDWERAAFIVGQRRPDGSENYRFFEIQHVHEDDEDRTKHQAFEHAGFYVDGPFRIVRKINNSRLAREAWSAFEPK